MKGFAVPSTKGMIVLMGSGELTATMVEVHKELLGRLASAPRAVFLDTPAGFQLNVDQISEKARDYFQSHVRQTLEIASFKSNESISPFDAEQAYQTLRAADYVLIGPGSPTYAVRQWQTSSIPKILTDLIKGGGCLVAASAAALTVGRFTLPVYEIYKVGQELHWVDGMDLLKHFGFNLVVVPHWNNAEGGNHDTRFCFMGKPRFEQLVAALPPDVSIFGLDEHTACVLDFESNQATIKGIGQVTLQRSGQQMAYESGEQFSLDVLRGTDDGGRWHPATEFRKNVMLGMAIKISTIAVSHWSGQYLKTNTNTTTSIIKEIPARNLLSVSPRLAGAKLISSR